MWREYFERLHAQGAPAVVTRTFTLELWPALLLVVFHRCEHPQTSLLSSSTSSSCCAEGFNSGVYIQGLYEMQIAQASPS